MEVLTITAAPLSTSVFLQPNRLRVVCLHLIDQSCVTELLKALDTVTSFPDGNVTYSLDLLHFHRYCSVESRLMWIELVSKLFDFFGVYITIDCYSGSSERVLTIGPRRTRTK